MGEPNRIASTLTSEQRHILHRVRTHLIPIKYNTNPLFDDWKLLRFCRSRDWIFEDIAEMLDHLIAFREEHKIDTLWAHEDIPWIKETAATFMDEYVMCTDMLGRPVVYQNYAKFEKEKLFNITIDQWLRYTSYKIENIVNCAMPILSKLQNRPVEEMVMIVDLKGAGIMKFTNKDVRAYMGRGFGIGNFYYPQTMGRCFIINAPLTFTALWAVAKIWLDDVTQKKITILRGKYSKELLEEISASVKKNNSH
jgi:hypothetical protein